MQGSANIVIGFAARINVEEDDSDEFGLIASSTVVMVSSGKLDFGQVLSFFASLSPVYVSYLPRCSGGCKAYFLHAAITCSGSSSSRLYQQPGSSPLREFSNAASRRRP